MMRHLLLISTCLLVSAPAFAHGGPRQADAHVHGKGNLTLSLEGKILSLELFAPGENFRPRAGNADVTATNEAGAFLLDLPKSAKCEARTANVEIETVGNDGDHDHDDEHEHDHDDEAHSGHTDHHLTFVWECQKPDSVKDVSVTLFDTWSGFDEVEALFLTDAGAKAHILTPANTRMVRPR